MNNFIKPKVAISMPIYNGELYLLEAVESVINQTYTSWSLSLVNDGSTDNSKVLIEDIMNKYSKKYDIHFFDISNHGETYARMYGFNNVKETKYLLPFDQDDVLHPQFLEKTVECLDNNKASTAYVDAQCFGSSNDHWVVPEYNFYQLLFGNYLCYASLMRSKDFFAVGGFDLDNRGYCVDYENTLNMGRLGYYAKHVSFTLLNYRVHEGGAMHGWVKNNFHAIKAYFVKKMPEIFPRDWLMQAEEILKNYPENFMKERH